MKGLPENRSRLLHHRFTDAPASFRRTGEASLDPSVACALPMARLSNNPGLHEASDLEGRVS